MNFAFLENDIINDKEDKNMQSHEEVKEVDNGKKLTVIIPRKSYFELKKIAKEKGMTLSKYVNQMVCSWLSN